MEFLPKEVFFSRRLKRIHNKPPLHKLENHLHSALNITVEVKRLLIKLLDTQRKERLLFFICILKNIRSFGCKASEDAKTSYFTFFFNVFFNSLIKKYLFKLLSSRLSTLYKDI